ncbi:hypothetical protein K470DRAFT_279543 [Piedraia hortae CBS 480.64]|uniref:Cryptic loci regulator 2 N-terminal domain-containing protein n=1 Tax=Piedraia hortae CBS 480.64 TaxID=1314780 RepID=A0A6A7BNV0_9PEZI|nr:hypothetical protein K470DRAFT_279543 [Piedraia hortae CBS 480.64]
MYVALVDINNCSDGDPAKRPAILPNVTRNDDWWCEQLGEMWAASTGRGPRPDVKFRLTRLPAGYAGFDHVHAGGRTERAIWGHPRGRIRSPKAFWPHFNWLQDDTPSGGGECPCERCNGINWREKQKLRAYAKTAVQNANFALRADLDQRLVGGQRAVGYQRSVEGENNGGEEDTYVEEDDDDDETDNEGNDDDDDADDDPEYEEGEGRKENAL